MGRLSNKKYLIIALIVVLSLSVMIFAVSYSYFRFRLVGTGNQMNVQAGTVDLNISSSSIYASDLKPIYDADKDSKASSFSFTVSRSNDSNLDVCYDLYLVVDQIGQNLRNRWFNYYISHSYGSRWYSFSNSSSIGTYTLYTNHQLTSSSPSKTYTLKFWLSYDANNDQTSILTGTSSSRTFSAHVVARGRSGSC